MVWWFTLHERWLCKTRTVKKIMTSDSTQYIDSIEAVIRKHLRRDITVTMHVGSRSMGPIFRAGDLIRVRASSTEEIKLGDVIVFAYMKRLYTHRVVAIVPRSDGRICLRCKGDKAAAFDRLVCEKHLLGRVVARERGYNICDFETSLWDFTNYFFALFSNLHGTFCSIMRAIKRKYKRTAVYTLCHDKRRR